MWISLSWSLWCRGTWLHVDLNFLWQTFTAATLQTRLPTSTWSPAGCILNVLLFASSVSPYIPLSPRHDTSLSTSFFKLSLHISVPAAWNKCTTHLLLRAPNMAFKTRRRRGGEQTIINETKLFVVFLTTKQAVKRAWGKHLETPDEHFKWDRRWECFCLPGVLTKQKGNIVFY